MSNQLALNVELEKMKLNLLILCWLAVLTLASGRIIKRETSNEDKLREFTKEAKETLSRDIISIKTASKGLATDFQLFIDSSGNLFSNFTIETQDVASRMHPDEKRTNFLNRFELVCSKFNEFTSNMEDNRKNLNSIFEEGLRKVFEAIENIIKYFEEVIADPAQLLSEGHNEAVETITIKKSDFAPYAIEVGKSSRKIYFKSINEFQKFSIEFGKFSSEVTGDVPEEYKNIVSKFFADLSDMATEFIPKLKIMTVRH